MQMVSDVMTRDVRFITSQENVQRAAQMMDELNVGAVPVCDGGRLVGIITDRDITVRATAAGKAPDQAHVDEVMSTDIRWCFEDQPLEDVMVQMADSQIRRVPVISHDDAHTLVGIVALGDIATKTPDGRQQEDVREVVEMVSSPATLATPAAPSASSPRAPESVAGSTGSGTAGKAATGSGSAGIAGLDIPRAGESGIGAAGASGNPDTSSDRDTGPNNGRTGATNNVRGNFGVGGQDLNGDGLPPA